MSGYRNHFIAGAILTTLALFYLDSAGILLNWKQFIILGMIVYFYSLLPDIDHENSKITWNLLTIGALIASYGLGFKYFPNIFVYDTITIGIVFVVMTVIAAKLEHRGPTHTVWFIAGSSLMLLLIPGLQNKWIFVIIASISGYSHLLMDGYLFKMGWQPTKGKW